MPPRGNQARIIGESPYLAPVSRRQIPSHSCNQLEVKTKLVLAGEPAKMKEDAGHALGRLAIELIKAITTKAACRGGFCRIKKLNSGA